MKSAQAMLMYPYIKQQLEIEYYPQIAQQIRTQLLPQILPQAIDEYTQNIKSEINSLRSEMQATDDRVTQVNVKSNMLEQGIEKLQDNTGTILANTVGQAQHYISVLAAHVETAQAKIADSEQRISNIISGVNEKLQEIEGMRAELIANVSTEFTKVNEAVGNIGMWTSQVDAKMQAAYKNIEERCAATFVVHEQRLTTKDRKAEQLGDKIGVADFRQWMKIVELQLDHVYGYPHLESIIDELRRTRQKIDETAWNAILAKLTEAHPGRYDNAIWNVNEFFRFLHGYLLPKLNTKLFALTNKIPDHNGIGALSKINNEVDAILENAEDLLNLNF